MELSALQQAVAAALDGSGHYQLTGSTLSQPVADVFSLIFGQPTLQLSGASVDVTTVTPSAEGTLSSVPQASYAFLAGVHMTATFRLDGSQAAQVSLVFAPPPGTWSLPGIVPVAGGGVLSLFEWSGCEVDFDSGSPAALPATFPACYGVGPNSSALLAGLRIGMSFQGQATFTGDDPGLALVLGSKPFHVSGPVEWAGTAPRMDLASEVLASPSIAGFDLPVEFHFAAAIPPVAESAEPGGPGGPAEPYAIPLAVLHGTLERPTGSGSLQIPFYLTAVGTPVQFVTVIADFPGGSSLGLADLAKLLGVPSLDSQQSSGFPALGGLALDRVELLVDWPAQRLIFASATVGFSPPGGPWQPSPRGSWRATSSGTAETSSSRTIRCRRTR